MSRGRPRHQSSRRRMYSPRQRDVRERRLHERLDEQRVAFEVDASDSEEPIELDAPATWALPFTTRPSAA